MLAVFFSMTAFYSTLVKNSSDASLKATYTKARTKGLFPNNSSSNL